MRTREDVRACVRTAIKPLTRVGRGSRVFAEVTAAERARLCVGLMTLRGAVRRCADERRAPSYGRNLGCDVYFSNLHAALPYLGVRGDSGCMTNLPDGP